MTNIFSYKKRHCHFFFIIEGFRTIVFIFIVISTISQVSADMSSGLLQVFVELGNLYGTSNQPWSKMLLKRI